MNDKGRPPAKPPQASRTGNSPVAGSEKQPSVAASRRTTGENLPKPAVPAADDPPRSPRQPGNAGGPAAGLRGTSTAQQPGPAPQASSARRPSRSELPQVAGSPLPGLLETESLEAEGPTTMIAAEVLPGLLETEPEGEGPTTMLAADMLPKFLETEPESEGPTTMIGAEALPGLFETELPDGEGPTMFASEPLPGLFETEPPDGEGPTMFASEPLPGLFETEPRGRDGASGPATRAIQPGLLGAQEPAPGLSAPALSADLDSTESELVPPEGSTAVIPFPTAPRANAPGSTAARDAPAAATDLDATIDQLVAPVPEDSTCVIAAAEEQKPAASRGAGAYSRALATRATKAGAREPEGEARKPDPALQARLKTVLFVLVGLGAGSILVWLLVTGNRPTRVELELVYPHGLLDTRHDRGVTHGAGNRGVTLGARSVEFKYRGRVPCAPNSKDKCLLYEYGRDAFKGHMVVQETDSGWRLVEDRM